MNFKIFALLMCFLLETQSLNLSNDNVNLQLDGGDNSISITLTLDGEVKIFGEIGIGRNTDLRDDCEGSSSCRIDSGDAVLVLEGVDSGFSISWETANTQTILEDCLNLDASNTHWYGGPEKYQADFPVENVVMPNRAYITSKVDNNCIVERYWLNCKGGYIFLDDRVPLYVDQNNEKPGSICFKGAVTGPYANRQRVILDYKLVAKNDPREGHLHAVNNYLGKPLSHPEEWIIRNPIWTTWSKYKTSISDDIVVEFATDIANQGFTGQIEIDDRWETCYGSLAFNDWQFSQINATVQSVKNLGFTVTLWTHPFVNDDCQDFVNYGRDNGFFIKSSLDGSDSTNWWEGDPAHHLDFTNEGARQWFTDRLQLLRDLHGIDAFKFDAEESDFAPANPVLNIDPEDVQSVLTNAYVKTCAQFGGLIEVRTSWRNQDLGTFVRLADKDSRFGLNNGLQAMLTSTLQLNLNGYVFVLPDVVGGNGYTGPPTAELLVRWAQASTFLPAMQFSYLPWEITSEDVDSMAITKKLLDIRETYIDYFLTAVANSIDNGTPVNPPVWWVDPTNSDALKVNDQYMLGEEILVAPIVEEGATSRDILLPSGSWKDGNNGTIYEGPQILQGYPAPIDVLPFFVKQ